VASADSKTATISNIMLSYAADCDTPAANINLGNMSINLNNATSGPGRGIDALFSVNPAVNNTNAPNLWGSFDLHWVQFITYDDAPATVAGVPAGALGLPFPVMDTPPNGWDYIYKDTNGDNSISAAERIPTNTDGVGLVDDANDILPWYQTTEEEQGLAGFGNTAPNWGLGIFDKGMQYGIKDLPGFPGPGAETTDFSTFLVAVPKYTCEDGDCMGLNQMLVLAGFDWKWSRDNEILSLFAPSQLASAAASINQALINSSFTGDWQAVNSGTICAPEPATWMLLGMAMTGLVVAGRRNRRAA